MTREKVKCGRCGHIFWKEDYESVSCPKCGHMAKGTKKDRGLCFITTACMKTKGLSDNCYQLQMMRYLRDNYLAKSNEGRLSIQNYYRIAPYIVECINNDIQRSEVYQNIFVYIKKIVDLIEIGKVEKAKIKYCQMVRKLSKKYNLEKKRREVEN